MLTLPAPTPNLAAPSLPSCRHESGESPTSLFRLDFNVSSPRLISEREWDRIPLMRTRRLSKGVVLPGGAERRPSKTCPQQLAPIETAGTCSAHPPSTPFRAPVSLSRLDISPWHSWKIVANFQQNIAGWSIANYRNAKISWNSDCCKFSVGNCS